MDYQTQQRFFRSRRLGTGAGWLLALAISTAPGYAQLATGSFYSSFGTNSGGIFPPASFSTKSWCITGATTSGCGPALYRAVAAPFRASATSAFASASLALAGGGSGTNGVTIALALDAGGTPGTTLESWAVTNLPGGTQPALTTINDRLNVMLSGGQTYWLVVQPMAADTYVVWYTNVLGLNGAMSSNGAGWSVLTGIFATQPAFNVTMGRTGALSHIAAGGGWTTVITLINTSPAPVQLLVNFFADDGSYLNLAATTTLSGATQNYPSTNQIATTLTSNTTLQISMGGVSGSTAVGWAQVYSTGPVSGYAIFRQTPQTGSPSEGTVPLQTQAPYSLSLPYDNTTGFVMGVALANLSPTPQTVAVSITDNNGNVLTTQTLSMAANGHTAFELPTQFPVTVGRLGTLQFSGNGGLSGLGLRFSPFGTFTSVPTTIAAPPAQ